MIDIENANKVFDEYVTQFNPENGRIKLKIDHIKRVANMSKRIAENLKLDEEQIKLAELIGLFHDIGRFKQAEIYNTFSDKDSINHSELSVKVLYEDNLIEKFHVEEKYTNIIKTAILNHNKAKITGNLTEEELLFAKIIRDADKLDIFYTICEYDFESIFWYKGFDDSKINDKIIQQLINEHTIHYSDIKTNADQILTFYAYVYDLNFEFSLKELREKKYLEKFTKRICEEFKSDEVHRQIEGVLEFIVVEKDI